LTATAQTSPFLISVDGTAPNTRLTAAGQSVFFPNAGVLADGTNTPISLRATLVSISPGDTINIRRVGDNPTVVANTSTLQAEVRWDVTNRNTGQPILGDPAFLITDVDGRNGNLIESVSAQCSGLTSYTVNGAFVEGVNANNSGAAQTNIRITEIDGSIRGDGTQNQASSQQEGYIQYNWTNVSSWTVTYFAVSRGRFFVHDADGDIPFDGTQTDVNIVDLATIKQPVFGPDGPPENGETITWEIQLSNIGPSPATGANIVDTLPSSGIDLNSVMLSATGGGNVSRSGTQVTWNNVDIGVNQVETLTITATVTGSAGQEIVNTTNTAQANESKCSSRDMLESAFIVAETPTPVLEITKSAATPTINAGVIPNLT